VLLDLRMPKGDGLATLARLREAQPDLTVIIISASDDAEQIERALAAGAAGYVVKSINPLDLPSTIRLAAEGTVYHPRAAATGAAAVSGGGGAAALTERERAVLRLVAEGLSNLDIASRLYVTEQTVKFHLSNIYRALGVANRTEAARYAFRNGLIE